MGAVAIETDTSPADANALSSPYRWWNAKDATARARGISDLAAELWRKLEPLRVDMLTAARLYGNTPTVGLGPRTYRTNGMGSKWNRISLNVVKAVCDTYVSLITKDRPKVTVLTDGASHEVQEKAKGLERFADGILAENNIHELDNVLVLDTAQFPLSVEHWYADTWTDPKRPAIKVERRLPWELLVDESTCQYGQLPREVYLLKFADRWELVERYRAAGKTEIAKRLETAGTAGFDEALTLGNQGLDGSISDLVCIVEAYRRARTKQSNDGWHCIVVGDVLLNEGDETYARTDFPIELNWRLRPSMGVYGSPLAIELAGPQKELNVLLAKIQRSHHLCAVPHLMVEENSRVNTAKLDNQIASLIFYRGVAPTPLEYSGITPDVYQHMWNIRDACFSIIGVNPMNAQGQLPPGVKSGRAMRTLADVTTQRFQPSYRQYQQLYLRRFRQIITLAREVSEKYPNFETKGPAGDLIKAVKWASDANLEDHQFDLRIYATNALADDPAERIEQVTEIQGLPASMKRLLDFPDLKADADFEQSDYRLVMQMADRILESGKYVGPTQYMNLNPDDPDGSIKWMNRRLLDAQVRSVPEEKLELMRTWLRQAKEVWDEMHPPAPPPDPAAPMPGAPPGVPPPGPAPGPMMPPPGMPAAA